MPKQTRVTIQCASCRQPVQTVVQSIVDAQQDADAKMRLVTGRLNVAPCPNCGSANQIATPLLYHDGTKELLITFVPMEVNLRKEETERMLGDMVRELTNMLPPEQRRGYLFNPRRALTMQGLVDQVLQADGVTQEMLEEQRLRVDLINRLLQTPPESLADVVQEQDGSIDAPFMQTMTVMAQRMMEAGQAQLAEHIMHVQTAVLQLSSFGAELMEKQAQQEAVVQEVAQDINMLGERAQREDFLNLALRYNGDDQRLQALVGLARPAFDYEFFQMVTLHIGRSPDGQRANLESLRDRLVDLTAAVDKQAEAEVQRAVRLLQAIVNSPDPAAVLSQNADAINDTFLAVLVANIEEAERRQDTMMGSRLKQIYQVVMTLLQENMRPELRFVNELLSTETDEQAAVLLNQQAAEYGEPLLEVMDAVGQVLAQRGDRELLEKLAFLRTAAEQVLG